MAVTQVATIREGIGNLVYNRFVVMFCAGREARAEVYIYTKWFIDAEAQLSERIKGSLFWNQI